MDIKKKPLNDMKRTIKKYNFGNFNINNKLKNYVYNNNNFKFYIFNSTTLIEYADYQNYYMYKEDSNTYINKILEKTNFKKIVVIWYLYMKNNYYNVYLTIYNKNKSKIEEISNIKYNLDDNWISASKTRNFSINDPLLDYLEYNNIYDIKDLKRKRTSKNILLKKRKLNNKKFQTNILLDNGKIFENNIYSKLLKLYKKDIVIIIPSNDKYSSYKIRDTIYFHITKLMIKKGVPIIFQGVLHDPNIKIYGAPDIIIKSNYINKIFKVDIRILDKKISSINNFPYYIIDIKNSIINISKNQEYILNSSNIKPYKTQIAIYYKILNNIQKYTTGKAFILPYKTSNNNEDENHLGIIDFLNYDKEYIKTALDAIEWIRLIKKSNNNLNCLEPNNINLYPNMSNTFDGPFRNIKKYLADKNNEITNLWMCGPKNRERALKYNINKWSDLKLNSKILNINGNRGKLLDMMLDFNRNSKDKIYPKKIKSNFNNWRDNKKLSFYIDFETINLSLFEHDKNDNILFLVGIGNVINNKWNYEYFVVMNLDIIEQIKIINNMIEYIALICKKYNTKIENISLYHWSKFEPITFNNLCNKFNIIIPNYKWVDIIELFHIEPIFIKGALNYSLKTIGKAMYKNKLIDIIWDKSDCNNGFEAMYKAYIIYKNLKSKEDIYANKEMEIIKNYNNIDCKIMWKILVALNKYA